MIAALILVASFLALVQFLVFYIRSLIVTSRKCEISQRVLEIAGVAGDPVEAAQFGRLLQLIDLCPSPGGDELGIRAVRTYFNTPSVMLTIVPRLPAELVVKVSAWLCRERAYCAHFAAIVLDQRMEYNRIFLTRNAGF